MLAVHAPASQPLCVELKGSPQDGFYATTLAPLQLLAEASRVHLPTQAGHGCGRCMPVMLPLALPLAPVDVLTGLLVQSPLVQFAKDQSSRAQAAMEPGRELISLAMAARQHRVSVLTSKQVDAEREPEQRLELKPRMVQFVLKQDLRSVACSVERPGSSDQSVAVLLGALATELRRCSGLPATISRHHPGSGPGPFGSALQVDAEQAQKSSVFQFLSSRKQAQPGRRLQLQWEPVHDAALALADVDLSFSSPSPSPAADEGFSRTSAGRLLPPTEASQWPSIPRPLRSVALTEAMDELSLASKEAELDSAVEDKAQDRIQRRRQEDARRDRGQAFLIRPRKQVCASGLFRFPAGPPPLRYVPISRMG